MVRRSATASARALATSTPRSRAQPEPAGSVGPSDYARVFAVDVLTCPHCGGARSLIAMIADGLVVRRILGPPRAAQQRPGDRSRQSAARARVRLVVPSASELRASRRSAAGWRHAQGPVPSAPDILQGATGAAQSSGTGLRGTGSTRPWARDLRGIGPNRFPLRRVIRLELLSPTTARGALVHRKNAADRVLRGPSRPRCAAARAPTARGPSGIGPGPGPCTLVAHAYRQLAPLLDGDRLRPRSLNRTGGHQP